MWSGIDFFVEYFRDDQRKWECFTSILSMTMRRVSESLTLFISNPIRGEIDL